MATVKVKFRPSSVITKEGTLYYQITHDRVVRQINTGYKLYPTEWHSFTSQIVVPPNAEESRYHYLLALQNNLKKETARLAEIIVRLNRTDSAYTADRIVELYNLRSDNDSFLLFTRNLIVQLKQIGKIRTAETYTCALNSFIRFQGETDLLWEAVDSNLMIEYEVYLKAEGVCPNTSSYYMRSLRAIYNRAVEKELTIQRYPFKHVYTGIDKTVKRAVPVTVIRQIRNLKLEHNPMLDYARDIFMFSFYTRGMSFVDMAYLKKKDLHNGILSYRRQKTNQQLFIKWEKPMQEIIDKYDTTGTPYLLPIIKDVGKDERRQYKNASHLVNCKLKKIGIQLGLTIPLTTYVARHGWASIAKSKNIPISTISEAMGHDSENTTRIYLASLNTSVIDKANSLIIKSI
ncbi:site-specific integrase [Bacteroides caecimuris]|jgi:integrase|uniref:Integrase n=1 Tax=Bacteroides caecimuris TaxID=1796613 RepID=A0A1C7GYV3_9BACE|nr:site-specific integrase [Bacteroides caecimuris]ANU57544.1 integrase [Bacteroides caecimuris]OXE61310.1 integrase [Bacteroides caecimuris]QQR17578.1 site-specific integrase [Bacteroides caecimuris]UQA30569.1 site-specific integrase [Bacteroides caecimuris]